MASERLLLTILDDFAEKASLFYEGRLARHNGDAILLSAITMFRITVYCLDAGRTIINGLEQHNALNVGRGIVNADGSFVIELQPNDMVILDNRKSFEKHRMLLEWEYDLNPVRRGSRLIEFTVTNLVKVT